MSVDDAAALLAQSRATPGWSRASLHLPTLGHCLTAPREVVVCQDRSVEGSCELCWRAPCPYGHIMNMNQTVLAVIGVSILMSLPVARTVAQAPPTPDQMVAALKQNLAESQKRLRQYEWTETTAISLKGRREVTQAAACLLRRRRKADEAAAWRAAARQAAQSGGRRGGRVKEQVIENKKSDMQEYMEKAAALIQQYVPPDPAQIQKAKDAGQMKVQPAAGREGTRRVSELCPAQRSDGDRRRRESGSSLGAQRRDLSREAGGRGDAERPFRRPSPMAPATLRRPRSRPRPRTSASSSRTQGIVRWRGSQFY